MTTDARSEDGASAAPREGGGRAFRNVWRALNARTLIVRKDGRDRLRLPMAIGAALGLILLWWSWPIVLAAFGIALVARVEFVVVLEHAPA